MKALTLTQPWATLVAIGAKTVETRSWKTPYRGPLAIHAAKGLGPVGGAKGLMALSCQGRFAGALEEEPWPLPLGAIVAVCSLVDVVTTDRAGAAFKLLGLDAPERVAQEMAFGDYSPGRYAWLLDRVRATPTIVCKGALGLWDLPPHIERQLA